MQDYAVAREYMVDCQVRPSDVTRYGIVDAMLDVPRERFVPSSKRAVAYAGEAVELSKDRWLLDPRVFAKMLDAAEIEPTDDVLDIGCGTLSSLSCDNVAVLTSALEAGAESEQPFDVILVQGGVADVPDALFDQLSEGGRLVAVWMEGSFGQVRVSTKSGDSVSHRWIFDAAAPVLPGFSKVASFAF